MTAPITLNQFLADRVRSDALPRDLADLLIELATCCKRIGFYTNRGALAGALGSADSENVQGETQKKLDVIANDTLVDALPKSGLVAGFASEELEEILPAGADLRGRYLVLADPLDGSSNIDVNISVGTIFSILDAPNGARSEPVPEDFLQPGHRQRAAGYVLYGPSTTLVFTTGQGTFGFTLDPGIGEFLLTHPEMRIPEQTKEFAINASNERFWYPPIAAYIADCKAGKSGPRAKDFNMRWVASMVAEVHRILTRGGLFTYPADQRDPSKPGRLRLMYEANPMAMIVEQAGGATTDGTLRMLDMNPEHIHQRVPVVLGSRDEVAVVAEYYSSHA